MKRQIMPVKFSRHAKRRAKLYRIPESTVAEIINEEGLLPGRHELLKTIAGFHYPIKLVVAVEGTTCSVITAYPLKRGR